MKSLLVSAKYFPPQVGGISRMMWEICNALGSERVCCLTGVNPDTKPPRAPANGIQVYHAPHLFSGNSVMRSASLSITLPKVFMRSRPRVLQLATCYEGWLGLLLKRKFRIPFVVYAHGNEIMDAVKDGWDKPRLALREASRVLANSRFTAGLVEQIGVPPSRIVCLNPGCDTDRFYPRQISKTSLPHIDSEGPLILTVGNLVERKGQDMVIRAVHQLRNQYPGLRYVMVGDGPYHSTLENLAASLEIQKHVVFAGRVSDADLPRYYAAADVVTMASRQRLHASDVEGFGITFLEAGACAKPVVAGRSGGTSDAVLDGETGLLVDPEDPSDIARAFAYLLCNPPAASEMGLRGRKRILSECTWRHVGDRVADILRDAADEITVRQPLSGYQVL